MQQNRIANLLVLGPLAFLVACLFLTLVSPNTPNSRTTPPAARNGSTAGNSSSESWIQPLQLLQANSNQDPDSRIPRTNSAVTKEVSNFEANIDEHLIELRKIIPQGEFHVVLEPPFVVIGDESKENVQSRATQTIKWAVDRLKADYFAKDPNSIVDIWLFKDQDSYYKNAEQLFGRKPTTIYGYYSPSDSALVMNISTGGGTLVHEIVHPFIESNFPDCPSWFNEGLASLYEQSAQRNGKIVGLTNWRLRGLQLAIKDGSVPSFETLCSTTRREFYDGEATNYAQARYLCHYLQEHKLLRTYYHAFVKNADEDPTGFVTLKQILYRQDMVAFQKDWEAYVMDLRFQ